MNLESRRASFLEVYTEGRGSSRGLVLLSLVLGVAACAPASSPALSIPLTSRQDGIDTLLLRRHTEFLAHDSLLGRPTGRGGGEVAARYIATACQDLGLQPVGGRYLHPVPLEIATIGEARMTVRHDGTSVSFAYPDDLTLNLVGANAVSGFGGRASYVGTNDEIERASVLADLTGAVAVTLGTIRPGAAERIREAGATENATGCSKALSTRSAFGTKFAAEMKAKSTRSACSR